MSAHRGSGRPPSPPELRRTESVRMMLRPGQAADLAQVAEGWGVPLGTAAYAIVAEKLAEWRGVDPHLGSVGVARAAASHALLTAGIPHVEPTE